MRAVNSITLHKNALLNKNTALNKESHLFATAVEEQDIWQETVRANFTLVFIKHH